LGFPFKVVVVIEFLIKGWLQ